MAFSYTIEADGLVVLSGSGVGDRQKWLAALFQAMSDKRFRHDAPILIDCTELTSAPPAIYVSALTDDIRGLLQGNTIAVVATLPEARLLAGQISLLTGGRLSLFASQDDAREWLGTAESSASLDAI